LADNLRCDGRTCSELRPFSLQLNLIPSANGSAQVRLADTCVLAVVKAEIGAPLPDDGAAGERLGRFVIAVDLTANPTGALDRRAAEAASVTLTAQVSRILVESGALRRELLCLIPGKKCWVISIDAVVLSAAGNVLDATLIAVKAALKSTLIPAVTVVRRAPADAETTATAAAGRASDDVTLEVSDDPAEAHALAAWDPRVPLTVTVSRAGATAFVDPDQSEEACVTARVSVAFNDKGKMLGTFKLGEGALAPESVRGMVRLAAQVAQRLRGQFDAAFDEALVAAGGEAAGEDGGAGKDEGNDDGY